jgi:DNA helicase-2/ATP-dependent DNA helicase PcrA
MEASVAALDAFVPPAAASEHWPAFADTIGLLRNKAVGWPAELDVICRWYAPHLERIHDDFAMRQADLAQLTEIASTYANRERFLTELTLDPPDAVSDEAGVPLLDEDYLILSTIHSAKGQEWQAVYILNVVDGCIPSDMATGSPAEIEEERRLLYVAMTRAKDELQLLMPQRFFTHHQPRRPPRLRGAQPVHSRGDRAPLRVPQRCVIGCGRAAARCGWHRDRCRGQAARDVALREVDHSQASMAGTCRIVIA